MFCPLFHKSSSRAFTHVKQVFKFRSGRKLQECPIRGRHLRATGSMEFDVKPKTKEVTDK